MTTLTLTKLVATWSDGKTEDVFDVLPEHLRDELTKRAHQRRKQMSAINVLSHIFLSLVLYNAMALGANRMMDEGGGYLWMFIGLGSAFLLGMQVMVVVAEYKGEAK